MSVKDTNVLPGARIAEITLPVGIISAVSLAGVVVFKFLPGFKYQIKRIRSYTRVKAGTVSAVVKVGSRTAASIVFTQATEVAQTLSATLANLQGSATEAITVELTTDGTGVLTNAQVDITYRPFPMAGEASVGLNSPG